MLQTDSTNAYLNNARIEQKRRDVNICALLRHIALPNFHQRVSLQLPWVGVDFNTVAKLHLSATITRFHLCYEVKPSVTEHCLKIMVDDLIENFRRGGVYGGG